MQQIYDNKGCPVCRTGDRLLFLTFQYSDMIVTNPGKVMDNVSPVYYICLLTKVSNFLCSI